MDDVGIVIGETTSETDTLTSHENKMQEKNYDEIQKTGEIIIQKKPESGTSKISSELRKQNLNYSQNHKEESVQYAEKSNLGMEGMEKSSHSPLTTITEPTKSEDSYATPATSLSIKQKEISAGSRGQFCICRKNSIWLERENVVDIAEKFGIRVVPIIGEGTLSEAIEMTRKGFKSVWGDFTAEGIVARPKVELLSRRGERIITKIKNRDFK
jgi:hypothetical protein